jgi:hypothetical protein
MQAVVSLLPACLLEVRCLKCVTQSFTTKLIVKELHSNCSTTGLVMSVDRSFCLRHLNPRRLQHQRFLFRSSRTLCTCNSFVSCLLPSLSFIKYYSTASPASTLSVQVINAEQGFFYGSVNPKFALWVRCTV